ncbi:uncharacterized protein J4E78_008931 [Alternaria triticimaculans]|uniref:uncharacterized protein n=1 Tax=Alternaria triticimaculans TaxID=297637 RepID=UPI0020C2535A|nr:uncharacterized protein J4E78_008931 [Alternaria triticimaculans]KAI4647615.1 hypothetical protein J4E78_008931 [Alternaria triticimaculans]
MPENDDKLVVTVITDNADVPSSSAPNIKARRGKVPTPSVTFATPGLESSPVEIPQATETQESVSSTEISIEKVVEQVNECRIKNATKLRIPAPAVKLEQISSNSDEWEVRLISEARGVPTFGAETKILRQPDELPVAKVWPPGTSENNYRAEIVLDTHPHAFYEFIATV